MTPTDRFWQRLTLAAAVAMPAVTALAFGFGTGINEAADIGAPEHAVVPAGYAFVIWGLIYSSCVAYGVFQALSGQRDSDLLRRVRPYTAGAFLATVAWLGAARCGLIWGTVACILGMLAGLAPAFARLARPSRRLTRAEAAFALFPVSVFTGWVTVAVFANTASAVKYAGWADVLLPEAAWAAVMVVTAGLIAGGVTAATRGNAGFALTVVWALAAIAAANAMMGPNPVVVATAGVMAVGLVGCLVAARVARPAVAAN